MRVAIWPHSMSLGGSQLNAVELAATLGRAGHEVVLLGPQGPLVPRAAQLGLEWVQVPPNTVRPSPTQAWFVRDLVIRRRLDVVHGFEWPPALTASLAVVGTPAAAVGTIMSMSVAPFLPRSLPITVGTEQIAAVERGRGRPTRLLVPPVDLAVDNLTVLGSEPRRFRERVGADPKSVLVVSVSRLAHALKSEGLLTAISVLPQMSPRVQLVIVGDGEARADIDAAARRANEAAGRSAVLVVGALEDPRPAYAAADVVMGLGGSVLRAMAFGKPVIVQGECGFWARLDATTVDQFLWTGWYGVGDDPADGPARLRSAVAELLVDPALRISNGEFALELVRSRFSMEAATSVALDLYADAARLGRSDYRTADVLRSTGSYIGHTLRRKATRRRRGSAEDFNLVGSASRRSAVLPLSPKSARA